MFDDINKAGKLAVERINAVPVDRVVKISAYLEITLSNLASITGGLRILVDRAVKFFDKEPAK